MNILITGSHGFLGRHLNKLLATQHNVWGANMLHGAGEREVRADVANERQLRRAFRLAQPELVYHLAAEFGRHNGEAYYEQLWHTNAVGTRNVLALCTEWGCRVVVMSSSEVYGDQALTITENTHLFNPLNDYAASKRVNEWQAARAVADGLEVVVVRPFNIYGPGEYYSPYRSVNCRFAYAAVRGLPVVVHRGHSRTSTYVSDAVRTLAKIAENFVPGRTYNLAGSKEHSITELAQLTWEVAQADPALLHYADAEPATALHKHVDNSLIVRELGHRDEVPLALGVRNLVGWMREVDSK